MAEAAKENMEHPFLEQLDQVFALVDNPETPADEIDQAIDQLLEKYEVEYHEKLQRGITMSARKKLEYILTHPGLEKVTEETRENLFSVLEKMHSEEKEGPAGVSERIELPKEITEYLDKILPETSDGDVMKVARNRVARTVVEQELARMLEKSDFDFEDFKLFVLFRGKPVNEETRKFLKEQADQAGTLASQIQEKKAALQAKRDASSRTEMSDERSKEIEQEFLKLQREIDRLEEARGVLNTPSELTPRELLTYLVMYEKNGWSQETGKINFKEVVSQVDEKLHNAVVENSKDVPDWLSWTMGFIDPRNMRAGKVLELMAKSEEFEGLKDQLPKLTGVKTKKDMEAWVDTLPGNRLEACKNTLPKIIGQLEAIAIANKWAKVNAVTRDFLLRSIKHLKTVRNETLRKHVDSNETGTSIDRVNAYLREMNKADETSVEASMKTFDEAIKSRIMKASMIGGGVYLGGGAALGVLKGIPFIGGLITSTNLLSVLSAAGSGAAGLLGTKNLAIGAGYATLKGGNKTLKLVNDETKVLGFPIGKHKILERVAGGLLLMNPLGLFAPEVMRGGKWLIGQEWFRKGFDRSVGAIGRGTIGMASGARKLATKGVIGGAVAGARGGAKLAGGTVRTAGKVAASPVTVPIWAARSTGRALGFGKTK